MWTRLRWLIAVAFSLLLALQAFVFLQQELLKSRVQHLLADFDVLKINRSTWMDGNAFIDKWHHWGYSGGPCTNAHCVYDVKVADTTTLRFMAASPRVQQLLEHRWLTRIWNYTGARAGRQRSDFLSTEE